MFRLRFTTDSQPRSKKGHPPQSTTGVASTSCAHVAAAGESTRSIGLPGIKSAIPIASVGIVRATPIQKRRVMDVIAARADVQRAIADVELAVGDIPENE